MPHWESAVDGAWEDVARDAGVDFVDPRWDVERVLIAIGSAGLLVTEAMHGAIVADALRTPWVPFAPISRQHHYKWQDWAATLDLQVEFEPSASSTWFEFLVRRFSNAPTTQKRIVHYCRSYGNRFASDLFRKRAVAAIQQATRAEPRLSSDRAIGRVTEQMLEQLDRLRRDREQVLNSKR
jgi:succinoglycan biosynthesis protein ExoV